MSHTTKYTLNVDQETDERFEKLVRGLADAIGRVQSHRGRRYPSRADLVRALLAVADREPEVLQAVHDQVRADLTPGETSSAARKVR